MDLDQVENPSRLIRAGLLLIAALVLGIGVWFALAPLSGAVIAPGFIKVDMNRKTVQHQEGGLVSEILVRDGSRVKAGETLLVLRDVRVDSSQDLLTTQLDSEMAKAARLRAEQLLARNVTFPPELTDRSAETRVAELIARETALFEARINALNEQTNLIRSQARETAREIEARSRQLAADESAIQLQKDELNANTALLDKGFVSKTRLLGLKRSLSEYEAHLGENQADLAQARQKVVELELKAASLRNGFAQEAASELKQTTAQIFDLQERLRPSADASVRQNVTAPISGEVVDLKVTTVGAVIGPRDPILEILPENPRPHHRGAHPDRGHQLRSQWRRRGCAAHRLQAAHHARGRRQGRLRLCRPAAGQDLSVQPAVLRGPRQSHAGGAREGRRLEAAGRHAGRSVYQVNVAHSAAIPVRSHLVLPAAIDARALIRSGSHESSEPFGPAQSPYVPNRYPRRGYADSRSVGPGFV